MTSLLHLYPQQMKQKHIWVFQMTYMDAKYVIICCFCGQAFKDLSFVAYSNYCNLLLQSQGQDRECTTHFNMKAMTHSKDLLASVFILTAKENPSLSIYLFLNAATTLLTQTHTHTLKLKQLPDLLHRNI